MADTALLLASWVVGLLVSSAAGYYLAVWYSAGRFRSDAKGQESGGLRRTGFAPAVSVLKPVDGGDPEFYENIRSHAAQDYPEFELLFGVADPEDPSIASIRRLAKEFPDRRIEVFVCDCSFEGNAKVERLERLAREARFDVLLVNDSDVRVGPGYLESVVQPLRDPSVGVVTCLYRARPGKSLASLLDALWISAEFQGQVLLARALQGVRFALGATMVLRRADLESIGGFAALRPYLADDYQLGRRIAALGRKVVVSSHPVEIVLASDSWRGVWRRHLRWSRTIRASRPAGHAGLVATHGTLWSLLALALVAAGASPLLAGLAAMCLALRLGAARAAGWGCVHSAVVKRRLYLVPLADMLGLLAWICSFFGNSVYWRNRRLRLDKSGRIIANHGPRPGLSPKAGPVT